MSGTEEQQWYADKEVLRRAIAKSIEGYKGQVEKRWHITPLSWASYTASFREIQSSTENSFTIHKNGSAGLELPNDDMIRKRIRRLHEVSSEGDVATISFMREYSHLGFDIEDAKGKIYDFEMIYNEGNGDSNTGFFAVVWERSTGDEVAHCNQGGDMETAIHWKKESIIDSYEPHVGLCPPTSNKYLCRDEVIGDKELHHEFFESSMAYSGIHCTHNGDKNQIELLIAVAAKLTRSNYTIFFPKSIPIDILNESKASFMEETLNSSIPRDVLNATTKYLTNSLFVDQDAPVSLREIDQWDE